MRALLAVLILSASVPGWSAAQGILPASTGCIGDSIVTLFRPDLAADSFARGQLDAHEAVHRAQIQAGMATGETCVTAFLALMATPEANLAAEVPAYRAQAQWLRAHSAAFNEDDYYTLFATLLYFSYSKHFAHGYILAYLQRGEPPEGPTPAGRAPETLSVDPDSALWRP